MFHGLTYFHTHQRLDRDDHIRINMGNAHGGRDKEFSKCEVKPGRNDYCL